MKYGQHMLRRLTVPFRGEVVILAYHRVFNPAIDPQCLCVSIEHFAEHLAHLEDNYHIMTLKQLNLALRESRLPKRAVVLTFDDGYRDLLANARPLLERFGIPASAFFATAYIDKDEEFWWDELERIVLLSPALPDALTLTVDRKTHVWEIGEGTAMNTVYSRAWHACPDETPRRRDRIYLEIYNLLRSLSHENLEKSLSELREQIPRGEGPRSEYRALRSDEICQLSHGELIEIGAHTVNHMALSKLPPEAQRYEVMESKRHLERIIGKAVSSFAYPYGGLQEIGPDGPRLAEEAGYDVACAVFDGPVVRRSNPYLLPRNVVLDWNGREFAEHLAGFFNS